MNIDTSFENSVIKQEKTENAKVSEMLRAGIKAAQAGNRSEAGIMLLNVTEAEAANESAWLWLASISEYPQELLIFLKNVLAINPENERALGWSKVTKSLHAKKFGQRGTDVHKQDQTNFAKQYFLQAIFNDDENELAWLWLASITEAVEEKMSHQHKVLRINPDNETAKASLQAAKSQKANNLMRKANAAAVSGQTEEANRLLDEILQNSPDLEDAWILKSYLTNSFDEKLSYFEKVIEINPANETAQTSVNSRRLMKSAVETREAEENQPEAKAENAGEVSEDYKLETESAGFQQSEEEPFEEQIPQPESSFKEMSEEPAENRYYSEMAEESQSPENTYEEVSYEKEPLEIAPENPVSEYAENYEEVFESEETEKEDFYSQNYFEEQEAEIKNLTEEAVEESADEIRFDE